MYCVAQASCFLFFFFNDTATTEIYTLSLHDALPISAALKLPVSLQIVLRALIEVGLKQKDRPVLLANIEDRSEEHTSELQSRLHLVCRLLLEKKKKTKRTPVATTSGGLVMTQRRDRF